MERAPWAADPGGVAWDRAAKVVVAAIAVASTKAGSQAAKAGAVRVSDEALVGAEEWPGRRNGCRPLRPGNFRRRQPKGTTREWRFKRAVERCVCRHRQCDGWHGNYYHVAWGMPVALLVPPTAENQVHWGWGVGNTRVTPICPQFGRAWPGQGSYDCRRFKPLPHWPSDTDQYGVYYVRGPW